MAELKKKGLTRRIPVVHPVLPSDPFTPRASATDDVDSVRKFMRENEPGSFPDTEGDRVATPGLLDDGPLPEGVTPDNLPHATAEPAASDAPTETPEGGKTPGAVAATVETPADKPAETPVAQKPAVQSQPEPVKPSYDPAETFALAEGVQPWTREQLIHRLQEYEEIEPIAAEARQFHSLFGYTNYAQAEAAWKPVIDIIKHDPQRGEFLDQVLKADPKLLNYLRRSAEFWNSPEARAERGEPELPEKPAQPAAAALPPKYEKALDYILRREVMDRGRREWDTLYERYPFLKDNQKAREQLGNAALALHDADMKAGKDELEARGLLDAAEQLVVFLEAMQIAAGATRLSPPPTLDPNKGPEAILPSTGPNLSGTRTPPPPRDYRGKPDDAVNQFLKDFPRSQ